MNAVKLLAWLVLPVVGLILVGMLAIWVFHLILGLLFYIVVGALVVGGGMYLYRRAKRALGWERGSRPPIDAAGPTSRARNQ
jgi:hypothetical protein